MFNWIFLLEKYWTMEAMKSLITASMLTWNSDHFSKRSSKRILRCHLLVGKGSSTFSDRTMNWHPTVEIRSRSDHRHRHHHHHLFAFFICSLFIVDRCRWQNVVSWNKEGEFKSKKCWAHPEYLKVSVTKKGLNLLKMGQQRDWMLLLPQC